VVGEASVAQHLGSANRLEPGDEYMIGTASARVFKAGE
jgi:hypothetical protein